MEKLTENNIAHSPQAVATVDQMAETQTNEFMDLLRRDESTNTLNDIIAVREEQKAELTKAEERVEICEERVKAKEEEIVVLRQNFSDVVSTIKEEVQETEGEYASKSQLVSDDYDNDDELDDLDPFAQMDGNVEQEDIDDQNRNRPDDDEYPPPPGDPDNNNYPDQSPPNYIEASAPPQQQPAPSAPPQEEADYPAPSAPPLEEAPIPNEPSPAYVGRSQPIQPSAVSVEPINNIEAKIAEPQPDNKAELKAPNIPQPQAGKEVKSTGGILGRLKVGADTVRKQLKEEKVEATVSQGNKNQQSASQGNINAQNQQDEPVPSEIKGPGRRR